jgi:hypothetical protein
VKILKYHITTPYCIPCINMLLYDDNRITME